MRAGADIKPWFVQHAPAFGGFGKHHYQFLDLMNKVMESPSPQSTSFWPEAYEPNSLRHATLITIHADPRYYDRGIHRQAMALTSVSRLSPNVGYIAPHHPVMVGGRRPSWLALAIRSAFR
ncbi:hypothetical protein IFT69_13295 [Pseudomonas putida]|nr:hypothetical protein [Pseudomonas putida]